MGSRTQIAEQGRDGISPSHSNGISFQPTGLLGSKSIHAGPDSLGLTWSLFLGKCVFFFPFESESLFLLVLSPQGLWRSQDPHGRLRHNGRLPEGPRFWEGKKPGKEWKWETNWGSSTGPEVWPVLVPSPNVHAHTWYMMHMMHEVEVSELMHGINFFIRPFTKRICRAPSTPLPPSFQAALIWDNPLAWLCKSCFLCLVCWLNNIHSKPCCFHYPAIILFFQLDVNVYTVCCSFEIQFADSWNNTVPFLTVLWVYTYPDLYLLNFL